MLLILLLTLYRRDLAGGPVVGLSASTLGSRGPIPGWGTEILQAAQCGQEKKQNKTLYRS